MEYRLLSRYRSELMGAAMLWVMLFHSFDLQLGNETLEQIKAAGFGGVDIFILLSCVGLTMSLTRREQDFVSFMGRRAGRILPAYFVVMIPYTLYLISDQGIPWSTLFWNSSLLSYWVSCPGAAHPVGQQGAVPEQGAPGDPLVGDQVQGVGDHHHKVGGQDPAGPPAHEGHKVLLPAGEGHGQAHTGQKDEDVHSAEARRLDLLQRLIAQL